MENLIEEYCRRCGDTFDPRLGCRCSLVTGVELFDDAASFRWFHFSGADAVLTSGQFGIRPGFLLPLEEFTLRPTQ